MAKNKKAASGASSFGKKKTVSSITKKTVKTKSEKINKKKAEIISEKINKMNKNFECLIEECQNALKQFAPHNN